MLESGLNNITVPAPAKLNLMLPITGQRADGYHELQTVFQFIDFADELQFTLRDDQQISRHCDDFAVPVDDDIIIHAAQVLRDRYRQDGSDESNSQKFGVDIRLKKNIPMGAGLGGGSSDAATTLLGLNLLWDMQFSIDELAQMGLDLGADVPVFVRGFAAFAEGVGEQLSPLSLPEKWYLVAVPAVKRPCLTKYSWNASGSTPSTSPEVLGGALNIAANSRSKSISSLATACRSAE